MFRLVSVAGSALLGLMCLVVLFVVILLSPFSTGASLPAPGSFWGNGSSSGLASGSEIAAAGQLLEDHVYGPWSNEYTLTDDPIMQAVYQFWVVSCGSNGVICNVAVSGNLQCVEFVTGAFFLSGMRLPYVGNAITFWSGYADQPGWERIPVQQGYPQLGDMVIWQGGEYGHIAIVINVVLPHGQLDGSVTVAQGNGMGNRWDAAHESDPGNWYTMALHSNGTLTTWSGYTVLGYIRQQPS